MLHLLSSLFSRTGPIEGRPDPGLVEAGIERAIEGTDRRLRGLSGYRKRLAPTVERAIGHIAAIVDGLPEAVEISRGAFQTNAALRAAFVSPAHMHQVIGDFPAVKNYLQCHQGALPGRLYGCLSMEYREKRVLGMEISGDRLQRDVSQVTVNFTDHRYVGPADSETATRRELENRGFDFMIEKALEAMIAAKSERIELEQQRRILSRKLEAMRAGNWGMEAIFSPQQPSETNAEQLEKEIDQLDQRLLALSSRPADLDSRLDALAGIFDQAPQFLSVDTLTLHIDAMMVKRAAGTGGVTPIRFNRVKAGSGEQRIVLLGYVPVDELPAKSDFFREAQRYLS